MKILFFLLVCTLQLPAEDIPRRVLAFWNSKLDTTVDSCRVHETLEMPLNHLGLDVIYADIQQPLPDISQRKDIRGIIICFGEPATQMPDPQGFIEWAIQAVGLGKKLILMNTLGFDQNDQGIATPLDLQNKLFHQLGFTATQKFVEYPFDYKIVASSKELMPFEKPYPKQLPAFYITKAFEALATSYLTIAIPGIVDSTSDMVIISPKGAYVSGAYASSFDQLLFTSNPRSQGWYFNPFRFFELAFDLVGMPIPDTTTLAGRRILTATCHGDGWNDPTNIQNNSSCAEIILEKIIKPHPDIPTAIAIIAADIDPKWVAKKRSQDIARAYFALPQVEAASHTYSHPLSWDFFRTGGPEREANFLYLYPYGIWKNRLVSWWQSKGNQTEKLQWGFEIPRSYANEPFDLDKEITGSVAYINQFAPPNNKVDILVWAGDSRPWAAVLELTTKAGLKNYGGGFVRFDLDYPSNLFVYPLGRKPGGFIQLYASQPGDNLYTNEWKERFYGFQYLPTTLKNTETPRRLKPILLYYHMYSGQFQSSVNALLSNIAFIKTQSPIPITLGHYCDMGAGFYSTEIETLEPGRWKIRNRKGLQTIRFDHEAAKVVDFSKSIGVMGYNEHQGSLYVYLDAAHTEPVISLTTTANEGPYLVNSSWEVWDLKKESNAFSFKTKGWGKLSMQWKVPSGRTFTVFLPSKESRVFTEKENRLDIELDLPFNAEITIKIEYRL